jgi:hypothetical protein
VTIPATTTVLAASQRSILPLQRLLYSSADEPLDIKVCRRGHHGQRDTCNLSRCKLHTDYVHAMDASTTTAECRHTRLVTAAAAMWILALEWRAASPPLARSCACTISHRWDPPLPDTGDCPGPSRAHMPRPHPPYAPPLCCRYQYQATTCDDRGSFRIHETGQPHDHDGRGCALSSHLHRTAVLLPIVSGCIQRVASRARSGQSAASQSVSQPVNQSVSTVTVTPNLAIFMTM